MEFEIYNLHGDEEPVPYYCLQYCDGKTKMVVECQIVFTLCYFKCQLFHIEMYLIGVPYSLRVSTNTLQLHISLMPSQGYALFFFCFRVVDTLVYSVKALCIKLVLYKFLACFCIFGKDLFLVL